MPFFQIHWSFLSDRSTPVPDAQRKRYNSETNQYSKNFHRIELKNNEIFKPINEINNSNYYLITRKFSNIESLRALCNIAAGELTLLADYGPSNAKFRISGHGSAGNDFISSALIGNPNRFAIDTYTLAKAITNGFRGKKRGEASKNGLWHLPIRLTACEGGISSQTRGLSFASRLAHKLGVEAGLSCVIKANTTTMWVNINQKGFGHVGVNEDLYSDLVFTLNEMRVDFVTEGRILIYIVDCSKDRSVKIYCQERNGIKQGLKYGLLDRKLIDEKIVSINYEYIRNIFSIYNSERKQKTDNMSDIIIWQLINIIDQTIVLTDSLEAIKITKDKLASINGFVNTKLKIKEWYNILQKVK